MYRSIIVIVMVLVLVNPVIGQVKVTAVNSNDPLIGSDGAENGRSMISGWVQNLYPEYAGNELAYYAIQNINNSLAGKSSGGTNINDINLIIANKEYFLPSKAQMAAVIQQLNDAGINSLSDLSANQSVAESIVEGVAQSSDLQNEFDTAGKAEDGVTPSDLSAVEATGTDGAGTNVVAEDTSGEIDLLGEGAPDVAQEVGDDALKGDKKSMEILKEELGGISDPANIPTETAPTYAANSPEVSNNPTLLEWFVGLFQW
jgi:hypothetical protein